MNLTFGPGLLIDGLESIGPLLMMAAAYGVLHRIRRVGARGAQTLLGLLFGVLTVVEMHRPMELAPGFIIDLRCVPVVLAGAFLGLRGLVPCLLMALATRVMIGGAGMLPGIAGIVISGTVGLAWAQWTSARNGRSVAAIFGLAIIANVQLAAALLMPLNKALLFLADAMLPMVLLNVIVISAVGLLLERESRIIEERRRLALGARNDPDTGLLTREAFLQDMNRMQRQSMPAVSGVLQIDLKWSGWVARYWGQGAVHDSIAAMGEALKTHLSLGAKAAMDGPHRLLVPVTLDEVDTLENLAQRISRDLSSIGLTLNGGGTVKTRVEILFAPLLVGTSIEDTLGRTPPLHATTRSPARKTLRANTVQSDAFSAIESNRLFDKTERLLQLRAQEQKRPALAKAA